MISIEGLSFSYDNSRYILHDISCRIEPQHCLAILGTNGAGKSTLLKCTNRIYQVQQGHIMLNGANLAELTRKDLARQIAYVPQNSPASPHTMVFDAVLLGLSLIHISEPTRH